MQISFAKINNTELKFQFGMATERERERGLLFRKASEISTLLKEICVLVSTKMLTSHMP